MNADRTWQPNHRPQILMFWKSRSLLAIFQNLSCHQIRSNLRSQQKLSHSIFLGSLLLLVTGQNNPRSLYVDCATRRTPSEPAIITVRGCQTSARMCEKCPKGDRARHSVFSSLRMSNSRLLLSVWHTLLLWIVSFCVTLETQHEELLPWFCGKTQIRIHPRHLELRGQTSEAAVASFRD